MSEESAHRTYAWQDIAYIGTALGGVSASIIGAAFLQYGIGVLQYPVVLLYVIAGPVLFFLGLHSYMFSPRRWGGES